MDIATLATTALTLASPFIEKIGEGTAKKIGEEIWSLLKTPFSKKNKEIEKLTTEEIKQDLIEILKEDDSFKLELEKFVSNAQAQLGTVNQNIQNNAEIAKQVNVGTNVGNINL